MDLLNIKIYSDIDDSFDKQKLEKFGYFINYANDSLTSPRPISIQSVLCEKTSPLNEKEIENACNISVNLKDIGLKKIHYIRCKIIKSESKPIPLWKKPFLFFSQFLISKLSN